jgi:hypothetical protein
LVVSLDDGTTRQLEINAPVVAGDSSMLLLIKNGDGTFTAKRVTEGAADSGGTGYKVLRVAN